MARRIVRGSKFRVGQRVIVDGDYNGDYYGRVVKTHPRLVKTPSMTGSGTFIAPGVTVLVDRWEGVDYLGQHPGFESFEIEAHDAETRSANSHALC
jgi:hypothetical protein